jgi:Ser/Thr protein kinase RdoA (MazF antagonist)
MLDAQTPAPIGILKSIPNPRQLAKVVADRYGLSGVTCQLIQSTRRDVFEVRSDQALFVLHLYPHAGYQREQVEEEWALAASLREAGVPAVRGVQTVLGNWTFPVAAPEGVRYATLSAFVEGGHLRHRYSPHATRAYGRAIAQIHAVSGSLTMSAARMDLSRDLAPMLEAGAIEFPKVYPRRGGDADFLLHAIQHLKRWINSLPRAGPAYGFIHGDVIRANCQVGDDGSVTLLDFDLCGSGWRAYDLASYLQVDPEGSFLEGYEEVRPINPQERAWLPLFVSVRRVFSLVIPCLHAQTWGSAALWGGEIDATMKLLRQEISSHT